MTSLILNIESKRDLKMVKQLANRLGLKSKAMTTEEQEDYFLLQAMLKGRKKDYVTKESVFKKLNSWS